MKALPKKLLPLTLFAIAVTSLFCVQPAQAYTVTLDQVGSNVVANGSGAINLMGLTFFGTGSSSVQVFAKGGLILTGPTVAGDIGQTIYTGFTGPASFGSGGRFFANTGSGDFVGILGNVGTGIGPVGLLFVPLGYVSNAGLSDSMTFNNATFASLGVTPGTYIWTWGTGLPNQNFTLIIGGAGVPDGGSTVSLLGFALLGLAALRRKLSC
jgi:hypothetical protein